MIDAAIQGIILGLALSVLIGPVFFLLIQTSIKEGFKAALKLELGIISSDAFCIFVSYLGLARVLENPTIANYVGLGGGVMLLIIGVKTYFSHKTVKEEEVEVKTVKKGSKNTKTVVETPLKSTKTNKRTK